MKRLWWYAIYVCIGIVALVYLGRQINANSPPFVADEMYWIGTARIVPFFLQGKWKDPFWDEFGGYANFNGAKWIYGVSLAILGHHDFSFLAYPPYIYYHYRPLEGKPMPTTLKEYSYLHDARLTSAVFGSLSIVAMSVVAYEVTSSGIAGFFAGIFLGLNPVVQNVSVIAFADTMFLFFQLTSMFLMARYEKQKSHTQNIGLLVLWGASCAMVTAVKLNGLWFAVLAVLSIIVRGFSVPKQKRGGIFISVLYVAAAFAIVFDLLHPNFFFYPSHGPFQIITERLSITQYHMMYFSHAMPPLVLWTLNARLASFWRHVLFGSDILLIAVGALLLASVGLRFITTKTSFGRMTIWGLVTFGSLMGYVVFDEVRYFIPILPFLIIFIVGFVVQLTKIKRRVDKSDDVAHYGL